ncbi:MAG: PLP-dependent transferase [Burkholderiales bacterium]|jgi:cystathionine beta-lyase|nr:PLP-dependent transferase [Burkholderiales bacterium]
MSLDSHKSVAATPDRAETPFRSLSPAVWRASTVLFDSIGDFTRRRERLYDGYSYGITGTPTSRELERRVAALEGAAHCVVLPSGQAALCLALMTVLRAGDHVLISDAAYGPLKSFGREWMAGWGIEVEFYPPAIESAALEALMRPATRLLCLESPGSITMEMLDIPAAVAAARRHGVTTLIDNTWASPLGLRPLALGVDISVEAASKMFGGHSDVLLGTVAVNDRGLYEKLRSAQSTLGQSVSPEDCFLVLRGLETLKVRLQAQAVAALQVAALLAAQPEVRSVLYPPLPGSPGHALWQRDFHGAGCVLTFQPRDWSEAQTEAFFGALRVFSIGASWGGVHSLAALYPASEQQSRTHPCVQSALVRLSVGLEELQALLDDLAGAFAALRACVA